MHLSPTSKLGYLSLKWHCNTPTVCTHVTLVYIKLISPTHDAQQNKSDHAQNRSLGHIY